MRRINIAHQISIYSITNALTKAIGIILIPLYTSYFEPRDFGIIGILEITIIILSNVLILGQAQALVRFYHNLKTNFDKNSLYLSIFIIVLLTLVVFIFLGYSANNLFFKNVLKYILTTHLNLCIAIIFFRVINNLNFSWLRAQENAKIYSIYSVVRFLLLMLLNILMIAVLKKGLLGYLLAFTISELLLFVAFIPLLLSNIKGQINIFFIKESFSFGMPLILGSLFGMLLNLGDRYILKLLVDFEEVGLYSLGYKIAGILNIIFIQAFGLSFMPYAYRIYKQKNAAQKYSKIFTVYSFLLLFGVLVLSLFSKEILNIFVNNQEYRNAYSIIPIIALSYFFLGAKNITSLGLYLKKKTGIIAMLTVLATLFNIVLNFLLIPHLKMTGAAISTLITLILLYVITVISSEKLYKINYDQIKVGSLLILTVILYYLSIQIISSNQLFNIIIKFVLIILYPLVTCLCKIIDKKDFVSILKQIINK